MEMGMYTKEASHHSKIFQTEKINSVPDRNNVTYHTPTLGFNKEQPLQPLT
jgi:hypothetical protein